MLVVTAARLATYARTNWQLVARLSGGGDEFAALRFGVDDPRQLEADADWLAEVLAVPIRLGDHEVRVGAAIGIAMAEFPISLGELLHRADQVMYRAKGLGYSAALIWDPHLDGVSGPLESRPLVRTRDLPAVCGRELVLGLLLVGADLLLDRVV